MSNNNVVNSKAASLRQKPVIAIDGPAGAGQKHAGQPTWLAAFGFLNLETGAMYRAPSLSRGRGKRPFFSTMRKPLLDLAAYTRHPAPAPSLKVIGFCSMAAMYRVAFGMRI